MRNCYKLLLYSNVPVCLFFLMALGQDVSILASAFSNVDCEIPVSSLVAALVTAAFFVNAGLMGLTKWLLIIVNLADPGNDPGNVEMRLRILSIGSAFVGFLNLISFILMRYAVLNSKGLLVGHDASCKHEYTTNEVAAVIAAVNFSLNYVYVAGLELLRCSPTALGQLQPLLAHRAEPVDANINGLPEGRQDPTAPSAPPVEEMQVGGEVVMRVV